METLEQLAKNLKLSKEMVGKANKIYSDVSSDLNISLAEYRPEIYPQGSFKLGTAIRPVSGSDEFDVDFVCLLKTDQFNNNPVELKKIVGDALKTSFSSRLEEKDRCWRLKYEKFHVDILPAIPENKVSLMYEGVSDAALIEAPIRIPEKGLKTYRSSNPKGYAAWFEMRAALEGHGRRILKDSVEPLPDANDQSGILQETVMLLKRHRDFMFLSNNEVKPISVIISTLAGYAYSGQRDILSSLTATVHAMPDRVNTNIIPNPVNPKENFADKWSQEPDRKVAFNRWLKSISEMVKNLNDIVQDQSLGIKDIHKTISENYGEDIAKAILLDQEKMISEKRVNQKLNVTKAGTLGAASGVSVKTNTFYGEEF